MLPYNITINNVSPWFVKCGDTKISLLKFHQVEMVVDFIYKAREQKNFKLADSLRDKLVEIGYYWVAPNGKSPGLGGMGHTESKLRFSIHNKEIVVKGEFYILNDDGSLKEEMIYFVSNKERTSFLDPILNYSR